MSHACCRLLAASGAGWQSSRPVDGDADGADGEDSGARSDCLVRSAVCPLQSDSEGEDSLGVIPSCPPPPRRPRAKHTQMMVTPTRSLPPHPGAPIGAAIALPSPSPINSQRKSRSGNRVADMSDTTAGAGAYNFNSQSHTRNDSDSQSDDHTPQHSPRFAQIGAQQPQQYGRHGAPALSPTNASQSQAGSASQRRQSKLLQPSSSQKKRGSMLDPSSAGGKKTPSSYVASRVWKNENTLTFGQRIKMAEDPSLWADAQLAVSNIVDVWTHYDSNGDEILNSNEVATLAADLVDRFLAQYRAQVLQEHPAMAEAELAKTVRRDVFPHLLQGENVVEAKRIMADRLSRELDLDSNGQISRTEFFFQWKNSCRQVLSANRTNKTESLSCVIL